MKQIFSQAGNSDRINDILEAKTVFSVSDFGDTGDSQRLQTALDFICNSSDYTQGYTLELNSDEIYEIDQPLQVFGDNWSIIGNNAIIRKTTTATPSPALPLFQTATGGYVDINVNAAIIATSKVRWASISDLNIEGNDSEKTITGIIFNGYHNSFKRIFVRWVNEGFHVANMFLSTWEQCEARNCVSGWFYDDSRLDAGGSPASDEQTGTSTSFISCHVVGQDATAFDLNDLSYSSMTACAVDGGLIAYRLVGCNGFVGQIGFERNTSGQSIIIAYSEGAVITIDSYNANVIADPAIEVVACKVTINGRLRADNDVAIHARVNAEVDATGLSYVPISGIEISAARFTTDSTSTTYYTPADTYGVSQKTEHEFNDSNMFIKPHGVQWITPFTTGGRDIYYGDKKLRVVYDVIDFDTTWSNQIKIPLSDIEAAIPNFDQGSHSTIPLQMQINERDNIAVGDFAIIRGGVLDDSGQLPSYWTSGLSAQVAVSTIAIVASELVITLTTAGSRQRVSCEIYQAK